MPEPVIEAVEKILNRLTDGLHETTRLNKRKIQDVKLDPNQLLTLKENGIDTSFLSAFHPESEASKNAELIDKTLGESAKLMIEISGNDSLDWIPWVFDFGCVPRGICPPFWIFCRVKLSIRLS